MIIFLWIRVGDNSNYNKIDDIYECANFLVLHGVSKELVRYNTYGVTDKDIYRGLNYISLYYGDNDGQPIKSISNDELEKLNELINNLVEE